MENQIPKSNILPKYIMPLIVTSILLSLAAVVLSVFSLARPIDQVQQIDSLQVVEVSDFETGENVVTYHSAGGDFIFTIPEEAVARQSDAGGKSGISVFEDESSLWDADSLLYSILTLSSSEFATGESYSFEEWSNRNGILLLNDSKMIGGWEFFEGREGAVNFSYYHYEEGVNGKGAYVTVLSFPQERDSVGISIQDSLNFNPTDEELEDTQQIQ